MPKIKFSSPKAFEQCKDGECGDAKLDSHASCPDSEKCGDICYCQLFRRKKQDKPNDDAPWDTVEVNARGEGNYDDSCDYKCVCVIPILGPPQPAGEQYAVRYVLCGHGKCTLIQNIVTKNLTAEGECGGDTCECVMFRLQFDRNKKEKDEKKPFDRSKAKWEKLDVPKDGVKPEHGYYYRCFCIKKA